MRLAAPILAAAALLAGPAAALASPLTGVAVDVDRSAGLVAVAGAIGDVALVHVDRPGKLRQGAKVRLDARLLLNGTYAAASVRVVGVSGTAKLHGVVLPGPGGALRLAAGGAVLRVAPAVAAKGTGKGKGGQGASRGRVKPRVSLPAVAAGTDVRVTVQVHGGLHLVAGSLRKGAAGAAAAVPVEGVLAAVADDRVLLGVRGGSLPLALDGSLTLDGFSAGQRVLAFVAPGDGGGLVLAALAHDGSADEADQLDDAAGDVAGVLSGDTGSDASCTVDDGSDDETDSGDLGDAGDPTDAGASDDAGDVAARRSADDDCSVSSDDGSGSDSSDSSGSDDSTDDVGAGLGAGDDVGAPEGAGVVVSPIGVE